MQRHTTSNEGKVGESTAEQQGKASAAHIAENQGARATGRLGQEEALARAPRWQPVFAGSDRLAGKVALVTGGDSGIGRAVAALFAREGADVAIVYRHDSTDASNTIEMVVAEGRRGVALQGDVGDAQFCEQCVAEIVNRFGRIDILVNNAGEQHPATDIRDISSAQMEQTFRSNIFGMFHMVQAVVDHLEPGSAIINCTSVTAYKGSGHLLDYSATKGAITAFTRSLSENLVEKGIRVNAVAPGPIWTPLNPGGGAEPEQVRSFGEDTPMRRPGEPNEVAPSFLFLACADSSYMSGQVLHPNGGTIVNG
ncbi:SDR family oxidoreductase [Novosphingobium sp. NBM11]|nr:SDR family oxidoreductase [Novosphingobium sp. NBM11]MBF5089478.1 SDR family oxidoreductase [Novosphingobium sp. NBM11]